MGYNTRMTREIKITPVLNGFVCTVGCQKVVFNDIVDMCENIATYYRNPSKVEKEFLEKAVNDGPCAVEREEPCGVRPAREVCDSGECVGEARNPTPLREVRTTRG